MSSFIRTLSEFFDTGGPVLYALLVLMICILALVIDRYYYLLCGFNKSRQSLLDDWKTKADHPQHTYIRLQLLNKASLELHGAFPLIRYLLGLAPLLGLLGTVTGMIAVFDAMGTFGTSNVRPIAAGISQATIPTMTGMVIAITGLWFNHRLHGRINRELRLLKDEMI